MRSPCLRLHVANGSRMRVWRKGPKKAKSRFIKIRRTNKKKKTKKTLPFDNRQEMTYQHLHNCFRLILFFCIWGRFCILFFFLVFVCVCLSVCVHLQCTSLIAFMSPCRVDLLLMFIQHFLLHCMEESICGEGDVHISFSFS